MQLRFTKLVAGCVFSIVLAWTIVSFATAKFKTYTGTVGDALCGVEHSMPGTAIECIRQCIGKGSRYSLIVGDKVYALDTENQAFLDVLEKQSAARVQVTGTETEDGKIIVVHSVKALP
jgi:hypothetical protein